MNLEAKYSVSGHVSLLLNLNPKDFLDYEDPEDVIEAVKDQAYNDFADFYEDMDCELDEITNFDEFIKEWEKLKYESRSN